MDDLYQCRLNYDILTLVAPFTSSPTLSTLMRTCRDAYDRYPRYILNDTACLRDDEDVLRFLRFMHVDNFRRWPYLWSLHFNIHSIRQPPVAQLLARALYHAIHLEQLTFDDSESVLAVDPALPHALAALPCVKYVHLQPGEKTRVMLQHIVWPLEAAELWRSDRDPDLDFDRLHMETEDEPDSSPGLLFKNARATLTFITTQYWSSTERVPHAVYPHVSRLKMDGVKYPNAATWSAACPNVKHLTINSNLNEYFRRYPTLELLFYERRRAADYTRQLTANRWAQLDYYSGSLWDLYISGIAGQITTIKSEKVYVQELFQIPGLFERACPRHLELHVCPDPIAVDVPSLFGWAGMEWLETVRLVVPMQLQEDCASSPVFEKFMTDIVDGLRPRGLKKIDLTIHIVAAPEKPRWIAYASSDYGTRPPAPPSPPPPTPTPLAGYFDMMDRKVVVVWMLETVPSLEHVSFCLRWRSAGTHAGGTIEMRRSDLQP